MTNEQIVREKLKNLETRKLRFANISIFNELEDDDDLLESAEKELKHAKSIENRIYKIIELARNFGTIDGKEVQCEQDKNRSAEDIWRIYNYYFEKIDIFTVMRALYKLVLESGKIISFVCYVIDKQVFVIDTWGDPEDNEVFKENELGVRLAEWRLIGLKGEQQNV